VPAAAKCSLIGYVRSDRGYIRTVRPCKIEVAELERAADAA
jgi:hypothetical protein